MKNEHKHKFNKWQVTEQRAEVLTFKNVTVVYTAVVKNRSCSCGKREWKIPKEKNYKLMKNK